VEFFDCLKLYARVIVRAQPRKERFLFVERVARGGALEIIERGCERAALLAIKACAARPICDLYQNVQKMLYAAVAIAEQAERIVEVALLLLTDLYWHDPP
jgi:hypothetical protein